MPDPDLVEKVAKAMQDAFVEEMKKPDLGKTWEALARAAIKAMTQEERGS